MDLDTSQVIAAVIGSNALFAFIQFLITRHDQKKNALSKREKAQNDMIIGLGHDKLLYLTDKFVQRGGVTKGASESGLYLQAVPGSWRKW